MTVVEKSTFMEHQGHEPEEVQNRSGPAYLRDCIARLSSTCMFSVVTCSKGGVVTGVSSRLETSPPDLPSFHTRCSAIVAILVLQRKLSVFPTTKPSNPVGQLAHIVGNSQFTEDNRPQSLARIISEFRFIRHNPLFCCAWYVVPEQSAL